MLAKDKQSLLLTRQPPWYSYIQSSPVRVLAVIEERKYLLKKNPFSFEIWICRNGQPDCDDYHIICVVITSI